MIAYKNNPDNNIVELVTDDDSPETGSVNIAEQIEADMEQHGQLRILHEVRSPYGTDPSTFWKDARFALAHDKGFSHIALVTDAAWLKKMATSTGSTLSAEVRVFTRSKVEEARIWLKNAP
ncbi:MAG: STAS/SEC14 domain-containing protein [Phormidesmis sp. RL_2_1]|nr:STAS/SEC14 domain-containing protein [Phormidesmis sp. RL_2_1]